MSEILVWKVQPIGKRACWTDRHDEAIGEVRQLLEREPGNNVVIAGIKMPREKFDALPAFTGYEKDAAS